MLVMKNGLAIFPTAKNTVDTLGGRQDRVRSVCYAFSRYLLLAPAQHERRARAHKETASDNHFRKFQKTSPLSECGEKHRTNL